MKQYERSLSLVLRYIILENATPTGLHFYYILTRKHDAKKGTRLRRNAGVALTAHLFGMDRMSVMKLKRKKRKKEGKKGKKACALMRNVNKLICHH